jgi:phenylpropionate dioxygenase-like ring-hydroxylating dioxygenase large terminal subunit
MKSYENILAQNIDEAVSLPFDSYTNDETFNSEKKNIFFDDWVFVGSVFEFSKEGDYISLDICGEPVLVIKSGDGEIRAFSNTCRHRGTILLEEGSGNSKTLKCPYHNWVYGNNGELKGAPFTGNVKVDKSVHCLNGFKIEIWQNLVFINLSSSAPSLSERYSGINKYLELFGNKLFQYPFREEIEEWNCNWKLAFENGIESYHLFAVHKETLETMTPTKDAFYLEGNADWTLTGGAIKGVSSVSKFFNRGHEHLNNYILVSLPPSFIGILTYDSLSWIQLIPESTGKCKVISGGLSSKKSKSSKSEKEFVNAFFLEDKEICERMHKSMNSQFGQGGKLVELERVVVDFRQYLSKNIYGNSSYSHYKSNSKFVL